jgi:hypothetical protein
MNCFEEIRNRLDIRMVTERYGIEIKRNNTCLCPFHNDHHPSAYIYPNAFHCFACNVHYDILGFVMELFGLSAIDAAKKLNDDFNLGIRFGHKKEYHKPKYSEAAEIREIKQFSNEEKIEWKWVVDKMKNFLDEHKKEEKPQSTESAGTYIEISRTKSPDSIPVNW